MINSLISSGLIEPSGGAAAVTTGGKSEAPTIIQIYHHVLLNLLKLTEKAAGARAYNLLEEAKAQVPAQYSKLLGAYDCRSDAKKNLKLVLEAAPHSPPGNDELLYAFNAWILAILHKQRGVLSEEAMVANLKELTRPDAAWQQLPGKSNLKGAILSTIIQTVEQFQQEVNKGAKGKGKGILSFLKRK
jgi:hypothetical protein